jgi:hypothetical protein
MDARRPPPRRAALNQEGSEGLGAINPTIGRNEFAARQYLNY